MPILKIEIDQDKFDETAHFYEGVTILSREGCEEELKNKLERALTITAEQLLNKLHGEFETRYQEKERFEAESENFVRRLFHDNGAKE